MHKRGHLLVELCIVLMLFSLSIAVVSLGVSHYTPFMVKSEAEKMSFLLRYLRIKALVCHAQQSLVCDEKNQSYSYDGETVFLAQGVIFGFTPGTHGPPSAPYRPIEHPITFPHQTVQFYKEGTISSGTIYLTDGRKTLLYAVTSPVSSYSCIRIYRHDGAQWIRL